MSLASDYAVLQVQANDAKALANRLSPASFHAENCTADVTESGGLRIVLTAGSTLEMPADVAIGMTQWLTATFGA